MIRRRISTIDQSAVASGSQSGGKRHAGKDAAGRFTSGNKYGKGGNAYSREQARIQAAIRAKMTDEELEKFVKSWIAKAKAGKGVYMISLLERWAGRVGDWAVEEQIQTLEDEIQRLTAPESQIMDGKGQSQASIM